MRDGRIVEIGRAHLEMTELEDMECMMTQDEACAIALAVSAVAFAFLIFS